MAGELGKASYILDADLEPLRRNVKQSRAEVSDFERVLDNLTAITDIAAGALKQVKIDQRQGTESRASASSILEGVKGIGEEARIAAGELDRVRITDRQAAESDVAGDVIDRKLKEITGNANEARRSLESMRIAGAGAGGPGGGRNPGAGVGPFGSGFGRVGVLGAAVGLGVLTTPAAGPATVGLLASIPTFAGAAAGSLGVLALAFQGVGAAIGGDKKAFDDLGPSAQAFVQTVRSLDGWFDKLKETAAGSLFPGLTAGLKAALSPGTVAAFTTAIQELGHALGMVGEQIGRYIGSSEFQSIFGPMMQSAALTVTNLSNAALSLFDALGVVGRAAIPLTDWMTNGIAAGARLADSWLHAKDATGQLGGAMNEAKTSLEIVGRLIGALLNAVGALGSALYPVSKIAVKDLTDGLNVLAGIIDRNKQTIRDIVSGALSALVGAVRTAADGISLLERGLSHIVGDKASIVVAILAIGTALTISMGPSSAAITGVILAIGLIRQHWNEVADYIRIGADNLALAVVDPFSHLPGVLGAWARTAKQNVESELASSRIDLAMIGSQNGDAYGSSFSKAVQAAIANVNVGANVKSMQNEKSFAPSSYGPSYVPGSAPLKDMTAAAAKKYGVPLGIFLAQINQESGFNPAAVSGVGAQGIAQFMPGTMGSGTKFNPFNPSQALPEAALMMSRLYAKYKNWGLALAAYNAGSGTVDKYLVGKLPMGLPSETTNYVQSILGSKANLPTPGGIYATSTSTSPFGSDPAFTKNLGPKPSVIPAAVTAMLNAASANASKALQLGDKGGTAKRYLQDEISDLDAAKSGLEQKLASASGKNKTQLESALTGVENKIRAAQTLIKNSLLETGAAILPESLKSKLTALQTKFKADSTYASVLTGSAAEAYRSVLLADITGQQTTLTSEVSLLTGKLSSSTGKQKAAVKAELAKVTTQLLAVQEQVVQTLQGTVQTLQQKVSTAFQSVQQELDTAFAAATQKMIDAAGVQFFQNGGQTPLEAQLAAMQLADQRAQVYATGDPRQIQEFELGLQAVAERTKADQDYAAAVKQIQTERSALETAMNKQLATLADGFANGTASITDLNAIATEYGVTLDQTTIPDLDLLTTATGQLQQAFKDLADYIAKITGTPPAVTDTSSPLATILTGAVAAAAVRAIPGRAIPMAAGGIGHVSMPTMFIAGEAPGGEDFAFSGAGRTFADTPTKPTQGDVHFHGGTFIGGNKQQVARDLKPYLDRIITL